jgi:hypothetical protein
MRPFSDCPSCGSAFADEYIHGDCPAGSTPSDHRHLVCPRCGQNWVERLPETAPASGTTLIRRVS